jgi:hypothetical protein
MRRLQWLVSVGAGLLLMAAAPAGASAASGGSLVIVASGLPPGQRPSIVASGPRFRRTISAARVSLHGLRPGRYVLVARSVVITRQVGKVRAGATAYPAKRRVVITIGRRKTAKVAVVYGAVVNPHARALPSRILGIVGDPEDPNAILLPGSRPPVVGTIFTSGPTAMLPAGLISKVTGITHRGAEVVASLVAVPVTEAVPELSFTGSLQLTPANGAPSQSGSEIPAQTASVPRARSADACGLSAASSLLKFGAHLDGVELREAFGGLWPAQVKLTLAVRTTETLGVGAVAAGIDCDWDLAEIGPWEAPLPVGPLVVPVYATIPVTAGLHVQGTLQVGAFNLASTTVAHAAAGGDENAASLIEQGTNVWVTGAPSVSGSAELSASISLQAGIGIAKVANLHVEAGFGPQLSWSSGEDCNLEMDLGSLRAGAEVLGYSLNTPSFTPFKLHLWSGCAPAAGGGAASPPPSSPPSPPASPPPPPKTTIPAAGPSLIYDGDTAGSPYDGDTSFADWANATGQEADVEETLPAELDHYKCVALLLNQSIENAQTEELAKYLKEGGTIVVIGEHEGPGWSEADFALNEFLRFVGAELSLDDDSIEEGPHVTFNIEASPLTSGVSDIGYNWVTSTSVSGSAIPLILTEDDSYTLVGAQTIGSGTVVVSGDSNMFSDNNEGFYEDDDNGQFVRDICP